VGNVKGRELANLCADNLGEVERAVRTAFGAFDGRPR